MSEEEESFQISSSNKQLTSDSDFLVTDSTSIRNPETNSSTEQPTQHEKLSSLLAETSQSLLSNQEKNQSDHNSSNESEKEIQNQSETESKTIEKENADYSFASHHSHEDSSSNEDKKTTNSDTATNDKSQKHSSAALTSSFDSSSMEFTYPTITTTTTTNNNSQNQNSEEDETIISASKSLLEKGKLPPFEIQGKVLQYLKSESLQAVLNCDYPRASKLDKAMDKIVQETYRRRKGNRDMRREKRVDKKVQKANYLMKKEEEESQTIYSNFLKEEDEKLRSIKERHRKELEMLKEEWNKPETLLPYNKSSQNLLSLRRSQKVLALSKRYEEAERLKKHADEVQKKELKEAKEKAKSAYLQAKKTLIEQHKKELQCFSDHKQRLSTFLDLERKKAITPYQNMASFYEKQQSARSLPNGKPAPKANCSSSNAGFAAKRATSMFDALPPTKPEIVAGVSKYKATPETHPLGLTSIMKTKDKKSSRRTNSVAMNRRPKREENQS